MKLFLLLFLSSFTHLTFAQALNERWHGTWQSDTAKIVITASSVDGCRWVNKPTEPKNKCLAHYSGSVTKKTMLESAQMDRTTMSEVFKSKQLSAEDNRNLNNFNMTRKNLSQISDDTFRLVMISTPEPEGSYAYFLDKEFIYLWTNEIRGGMLSIILTQFRKVN
jgi:hypothetical protein